MSSSSSKHYLLITHIHNLSTTHHSNIYKIKGYTLLEEDQTCQAIDCLTTSSGRGCATCVEQNLRLTNRDCGSCHDGYFLNDRRCSAFGCVIGTDEGCATCVARQSDRTSNTTCDTCNSGYYLNDATCLPYDCNHASPIPLECPGCGCVTCAAQDLRVDEFTCSTCHEGYTLSDEGNGIIRCRAYTCESNALNNNRSDLCETCVDQGSRVDDQTCETCSAGYFLDENNRCFPYGCVTGENQKCEHCVSLENRNSNEDCSDCNAGYWLNTESKRCVAYDCVTGEDEGCVTCVSQSSRTNDDYCKTCNDGYYLTDGGICVPFACETATQGVGCATCVDQSQRRSNTSCLACNDGHEPVGMACVEYDCIESSDDGCKSCVDLEYRSSDTTCATCNDGYFLLNGGVCTAWNCLNGYVMLIFFSLCVFTHITLLTRSTHTHTGQTTCATPA